jgi:hypothetical protein
MAVNGYELSRNWFDWCFENPEKISPNHTAIYFFAIEQCNRMGWKEKFGFPSTLAMESAGIKSYNTYVKTLNDLVSFGFILMIEKSKNQYSANIIALSNFDKALDKALDKAMIKHLPKQSESTYQSNDSIDKQVNNKQVNNEKGKPTKTSKSLEEKKKEFFTSLAPFFPEYSKELLEDFYRYWSEQNKSGTKLKFELQDTWELNLRLGTWKRNELKFNPSKQKIEERAEKKRNAGKK